ncbi:MAG: NAD(P)H-quinone oxidoreductase subunit K, partial [Synechococcus sp. cluster2_bin.235]|nr:NAD(P)H-quinone oxidoreductase subunit K [Synechococcus sp. cluster2_bin.235]
AMVPVEPIVTGAYLRAETQVAALAPGAGVPMPAPEQTESAEPVSSGTSS